MKTLFLLVRSIHRIGMLRCIGRRKGYEVRCDCDDQSNGPRRAPATKKDQLQLAYLFDLPISQTTLRHMHTRALIKWNAKASILAVLKATRLTMAAIFVATVWELRGFTFHFEQN